MYGMVNEGIREFIVKNHDEATWKTICERAGVSCDSFERMESYDDKITYDLVGAIVSHTGLTVHEVLEVFGAYWVDFAGHSTFGNLMQFAGDTFLKRLEGLDDMHARIQLSMPHLKPPSFELEELGEQRYLLHYYSQRDGLEPMVIGLLHGLAKETGQQITVRQITDTPDATDHGVFEITLLAA